MPRRAKATDRNSNREPDMLRLDDGDPAHAHAPARRRLAASPRPSVATAAVLPTTIDTPGFQSFTAIDAGLYSFSIFGAQGGLGGGGAGGLGAGVSGEFTLTAVETVLIAIGGRGFAGGGPIGGGGPGGAGGGGGTFVVAPGNTPLLIAGGGAGGSFRGAGGGAGGASGANGGDGGMGGAAGFPGSAGGTAGAGGGSTGGSAGGGGGGFDSTGDGDNGGRAYPILTGGYGGGDPSGGFGGGGGYSGGGSGSQGDGYGGGGGGGSFLAAGVIDPVFMAGVNAGDGSVQIGIVVTPPNGIYPRTGHPHPIRRRPRRAARATPPRALSRGLALRASHPRQREDRGRVGHLRLRLAADFVQPGVPRAPRRTRRPRSHVLEVMSVDRLA
jgi:hypothetical protein